jgi:tRNA G37 N-methylase Trm5
LDKNPPLKTVINKVDNVGAENEFRTFAYEVLAGPDDLNVEVTEAGCIFKFDYSKVYWNSKLDTEHKRITALFKPGEVVADVMAGIGPFAVPAGKKGVFVWANDKNPESFRYLEQAVRKNKVGSYPCAILLVVLFLSEFNELMLLYRPLNTSNHSTRMHTNSSRKRLISSSKLQGVEMSQSSSHPGSRETLRRRLQSLPRFPFLPPSRTS